MQDIAGQDIAGQDIAGQKIAVLSTRTTESDSVEGLSDFAQGAGLRNLNVLSSDSASSTALEALCPAGWPFGDIRAEAHKIQIDVNIVPAYARRKKLLLADMDATIIRGESLDELAQLAGIAEQVAPITKKAMTGKLDFTKALSARLALLAGQPESLLDKVIENTRITDGAHEVVATMRAHGARCYLVSGGFTFLTSVIAEQLKFSGHHSNVMDTANGLLTGKAVLPVLGKQAKLNFLQHYISKHNVSPEDSLCVGDGANDMDMLRHAGMGVAFEGKAALCEQIDLQLNHTDLTGLLYLQGYHADEFSSPPL